MDPKEHFVREWSNQTTLHPIGLSVVLLLGLALLIVPRRLAVWPMVILACFVPTAQRIVLLGADFDLFRIMMLFGTARVLSRGEYRGIRFSRLDYLILAWGVIATVFPILRSGSHVLMNRLGNAYDVFGMYFFFRSVIRNVDDVHHAARGLMYVSLPVTALFVLEWLTARNVFSVFGGVPQITAVRDGRLRCQGPFSHPILAGCFWAAMIPLISTLWRPGRKAIVFLSCTAAFLIIVTCSSATPVVGAFAVLVGFGAFFVRSYTRLIRWGVILLLVSLHMVMNAPVWHLIARTSFLGGSSWHRFLLIDGAIRHFHEWWLVGSYVGTAHWGHYTFDVCNHYILQGIEGGMLQLLVFISIFVVGFGAVGTLIRNGSLGRVQVITAWAVGVSLFVHAVNLFGVSYFGQNIWVGWYLTVCSIAGMSSEQPVAAHRSDEME